ncbi:MAG: hypothetical protein ACK55I_01510, partial [bacterium]
MISSATTLWAVEIKKSRFDCVGRIKSEVRVIGPLVNVVDVANSVVVCGRARVREVVKRDEHAGKPGKGIRAAIDECNLLRCHGPERNNPDVPEHDLADNRTVQRSAEINREIQAELRVVL